MALKIKLAKFFKDMLPSLAGVIVGILVLFSFQGISNWFYDKPEAIQRNNYRSYFIDEKAETQVIMFGTKWCQYCAKAREYFVNNNIVYIDHDVESSDKAMELFKQLQGNSYPLILQRGVKIIGFDKATYDDLINTTNH